MGIITEWKGHLQYSVDAGYNVIHFVPLAERGISNSPYSIADQHSFSDELFPLELHGQTDAKEAAVRDIVSWLQNEKHVFAISDIVWNHTANSCSWLLDHPEAGKVYV